jgi:hypothetical protein
MPSLKKLEKSLRDNILDIERKFLSAYFPANPTHTPDAYQHDVKAYCILAHAIFEEFVEVVSLEVMKNTTSSWLSSRRISDALFALCTFYDVRIQIEENEEAYQDRPFDAFRKLIDEAKSEHSTAVLKNQGFSMRHLRRILTPVAINVTSDLKITNSLRTLADARGSYAHTLAQSALYVDTKKVQKAMTPESARDAVADCLELCLKLSKDAARFLRAPAKPRSKKAHPSQLSA